MNEPTGRDIVAAAIQRERAVRQQLEDDLLTLATPRQRDQLSTLRTEGWHLRVWHRNHPCLDLLFDGADNHGQPVQGTISLTGTVDGHDLPEPPMWLQLDHETAHVHARAHEGRDRRDRRDRRQTPADSVQADLAALELA